MAREAEAGGSMDNPFGVASASTPPKPAVPRALMVLAAVPLLLVALGGLLGALIGGVAAALNMVVARTRLGVPARVAAMLGLTVVAVVVYIAVVIALTVTITSVETLKAGTCLNGIHPGATVTANVTKPVDCGTTHDDEIVGVVSYTGAGAYPGQAAVESFAEAPCVSAFGTYVGIDFASSNLDMMTITPSELTWARGDRQISCVAITRDGNQLIGSVKGSGH
jgi:hypothetical protein